MKWFDIPVLMRRPARPQKVEKRLLAESLEPRTLLSADGVVALPALTAADDELVGTLPATAGYQAAEAAAIDIGGEPQQAINSFVGWAHAPEDDGQIRVQKANGGEVQTFDYNAQTQVLDAQGVAMAIDELEGLKVRVTYVIEGTHQVAEIIQVCTIQVSAGAPRTQQGVGDGPAASSSGNQAATQTDSFVGTVKEVDEKDSTIKVQKGDGGNLQTFHYDKNTKVLDADGDPVKIDELEDVKVRVTYHTKGTKQVADKIEILRHQLPSLEGRTLQTAGDGFVMSGSGNQAATQTDFLGTVKKVDEKDSTIKVQKGDGDNLQTFHYDKNTKVLDADGDPVKIDELEGVRVRVTYHTKGTKQVADKIQILRHQVSSLEGRTLQAAGDAFSMSEAAGEESHLENAGRAAWFTAHHAPRDAEVTDRLFGGGSWRWRF